MLLLWCQFIRYIIYYFLPSLEKVMKLLSMDNQKVMSEGRGGGESFLQFSKISKNKKNKRQNFGL